VVSLFLNELQRFSFPVTCFQWYWLQLNVIGWIEVNLFFFLCWIAANRFSVLWWIGLGENHSHWSLVEWWTVCVCLTCYKMLCSVNFDMNLIMWITLQITRFKQHFWKTGETIVRISFGDAESEIFGFHDIPDAICRCFLFMYQLRCMFYVE
jgi:hypothetical protein